MKAVRYPVKCPAAATTHLVLSHNDEDVECQISGRVRAAATAPCTGDYTKCALWRTAKQVELARADERQRVGTLPGLKRETVRV